jgi:hypothetical protein
LGLVLAQLVGIKHVGLVFSSMKTSTVSPSRETGGNRSSISDVFIDEDTGDISSKRCVRNKSSTSCVFIDETQIASPPRDAHGNKYPMLGVFISGA